MPDLAIGASRGSRSIGSRAGVVTRKLPAWLAGAATPAIFEARERAATEVAKSVPCTVETACELIPRANALIDKLDVADRRYVHILVCLRDQARVTVAVGNGGRDLASKREIDLRRCADALASKSTKSPDLRGAVAALLQLPPLEAS
jgi:hypothetical protein